MIILAIGHKSRQGKDALADMLVRYLRMNTAGKTILKVGWADLLKEVCYRMYGWAGIKPMEYYESAPEQRDKIIPALGCNVVEWWIKFGNHVRELDPNAWINGAFGAYKADVLVFKDTRFPNECKAVKERNGKLIRVSRPGSPGLESISDNALNDYDGWDEDITNNGSLNDLNTIAVNLARKYVLEVK